MVRRVLKDNKVPGTSTGTRADEAPSRAAGSVAGFLGESRVNGSLHCQARLEQHRQRPGCLKSQGGNKDKVVNTQGLCAPTETVDAGWGELGLSLIHI